ncbi:MAG: hypothetical protein AAF526_06325 [Pseudomonadota bacterium]
MKRSSKLTERDKDLYTILICLLLIMPYILVVYAETREEKRFTTAMINRKLDRIEKRTKAPPVPEESAKTLEERVDAFKKASGLVAQRLLNHEKSFATLQSVDEVKQLRLEITKLADFTGVSVVRFGELQDSEGIDSLAVLMEETRNEFKRPIMELEVSSDYSRLASFIGGLDRLSKTVAIVRFDVEAPEFNLDPSAPAQSPLLTARLDLAL